MHNPAVHVNYGINLEAQGMENKKTKQKKN